MKYEDLLAKAPPADTDSFIDFLRENNVVDLENSEWIVIENVKYHTDKKPWLTAFAKKENPDFLTLSYVWGDWKWLKKPKGKQTIPTRFHIHMTRE